MAPRRKEPTPGDATSGTEVDFGSEFNFQSQNSSLPKALQNIEKWKTRRTEIRAGVAKDHAARLRQLKSGMNKHYKDDAQKRSTHNTQQLSRLVSAMERRTAAETAINERLGWLREECAYMAKLVSDIYEGRSTRALEASRAVDGRDSAAATEKEGKKKEKEKR
ncbi:hypothetical protein F4779DRAFT_591878 [Xylariaceae sp. FL0662B]|nr:hypothetical protein F4779DRAFT_591878 [Xylariaceae sp. FL0662B]